MLRLSIYVLVIILILLLPSGCGEPVGASSLSGLSSPDPAVKVQAIKWAGDNKLNSAIPQLVDLLEDEDRVVRFYAIGSLRRITGLDHGYDFKTDAHSRLESVKCWRENLQTETGLLENGEKHLATKSPRHQEY